MKVVNKIKQTQQRHQQRKTPSGCQFVFADSIRFINQRDWTEVAKYCSVFLSLDYLDTLERFAPENTKPKYAIAYEDAKPVAIIVCQIAEINGTNLFNREGELAKSVAEKVKLRLLVCGNLVSSGLHGLGFAPIIDEQRGWRIASEAIYQIRRSEKPYGGIDFMMVKDIKGNDIEPSNEMAEYSYRPIKTDPDMLLTLPDSVNNFDDYLAMLTSKYRSRIKKMITTLDANHFTCQVEVINAALEAELYPLYQNVERKSRVRLASLSQGYFESMDVNLAENCQCIVIRRHGKVAGFITVVFDGDAAMAYYVGLDYALNADFPIYFRLFHLTIELALSRGCRNISFGRTALEPKASLGAKPVETIVWARHNDPSVNFVVRKFFSAVPAEEAPARTVIKGNNATAT